MSPDLINGLFEFGGGAAVLLSARALWRDKFYAGLSPWNLVFFQTWGLWNLFYYPQLGQPWSFVGGLALALANATYLFLLWRYRNGRIQREGR
jgi:hypothetical protein